MNDTVNEPLPQSDARQDSQPPAPRRGSRSAKWSLSCGVLAWLLTGVFFSLMPSIEDPYDCQTVYEIGVSLVIGGISRAVPLLALIAIIMGHLSSWKSYYPVKSPQDRRAIAGRVLGYLMLIVIVAIILPAWAKMPSEANRPSCENNLKRVGYCLQLYGNEDPEGFFPQLSSQPGLLSISNTSDHSFYPQYLAYPAMLFCLEKRGQIEYEKYKMTLEPQVLFDNSSYIYLGYALEDDEEVEAFAEAYRQRIAQGLPFNEDLTVPPGKGNNGSDTIHRLRYGVEKFFVPDGSIPTASLHVMAEIPLLIERPGNHKRRGGNVLYLAGNVEFRRYPGDWPMTEKTMAILQSIEAMKK